MNRTSPLPARARRLMALCPLLTFAVSLSAQTTESTPPASAQTTPPVPVTVTKEKQDDTIVLSPFQVVANNNGYYAANTMSGTRFNTKLDDLASSITVMTKTQMQDFAMVDINDVFLYVAGTEGIGTYTSYALDRNGSIGDNVQINPTGANRVRGIAPANISFGNIETMNRAPIDELIVESIEVSRGPNANVFGLGNPSGTVNQVPANANLQRNRAATTFRVDSYGGTRNTLDLNRVLIPEKLAIRGSGVFQHEAFERKPSGVDTERYNGMIKYQPFKYTTITGAMYYHHAYGNRPNALPPRDNYSYWLAQGRPTWDPVTQTIHNSDGSVRAVVPAATYNGPDIFNAVYLGNDHNQMFIDPVQGLTYWASPRSTTSTVGPTLATVGASRYLQTSGVAGSVFSGTAPRPFAQYLFNTTPTVSDKSVYDYESINLSAPNRFWDKNLTSLVNLDQMIINTPTQTFAAQFTFMREDSERWARDLVGIANDNGQSGQLMPDINERRLDGSANPYFLRPYLSVDKPRTVYAPAKWDTTRGQLAYRLDLTKQNNFLKHLGWFQATGYGEYKYRVNRVYSYRDAIASDVSWLAAGLYRGYQGAPAGTPASVNLTQGLYRYYVGDNQGNNVDYAPGDFKYGVYPFVWGNSANGVFRTDNLLLAPVAANGSGGTSNTKITIKTAGGVFQSHLFGDRLVTTLGARYDDVFTQFGNQGTPSTVFLNSDGMTFNYDLINGWSPIRYKNGGRTNNVQFVARPLMNTPITARLANSANGGSQFLGDALNNLSVNFNKSNSFLPLNPAQDLFQKLLPNPTGTDKSYGFGLNLFGGKVVLRATHFDNLQKDAQNGDSSTMAVRVTRTDVLISGATAAATGAINLRERATIWVGAENPTWTAAQVAAEVASRMKLTQQQIDNMFLPSPPIGTTNDIRSRGNEFEVNINPSKFWTMSASVTDTKSLNLNVSKTLADWIALRMPVWTTIVDTSIGQGTAADLLDYVNGVDTNPQNLWWKHRINSTGQTPEENFQAFVNAPYGIIKAQEGKNNPQVRRYAFRGSTSYRLAGLTDKKWLKNITVGGALRWEDKGAIGYYGVQSLPAIITDLDPNRPIYDGDHFYVDAFVSYKTRLWHDKIGATFQLNVRNLGENGRLQPVGAFPDGTIHTFRIIDPQLFVFQASFDL